MNSRSNTLVHEKTAVEITNISPFGFWLLAGGKEYFIDYNDYPVFKNASIRQIAEITADIEGNLHWTSLDADVELDALDTPEVYPLEYK
ncbi:MAG: DUF2442 domain-containing protein [Treponema sp.]|nr:DUF2442 domain-containing protein [Treponema sp.]